MSSDIKGKVGWLKDENGEIFIPKTLTSAIQNAEGTNLDNLLKNLSPSPDGEGGNSQNGGVNATISTLYTNEAGTAEDTINLTDDISNYDLLLLEGFHKNPHNDGYNFHNSSIYNANELCASPSAIGICNDANYVWYQLSDNRTLSLKYKSRTEYMLSNIYGIKFNLNSGSGSGSYAETILYDGGYTKDTNIELSDDINNYDYIKIIFGWMDNGNLIGNGQPIYITPKELEHNNSSYKYGNICTLYSTQHVWYSVTGSNYKLLFDGGSNVYLYQIIGIKFVSDSTGGSGGGGSYTETLLANGTYSKGSSISLSENYDNFDELVFIDKNTNPDGYITNHIFKKSTLDYVVSNNYKLELYGYSAIFTTLTFVDNKTINILDGNGIIYKVYGVKY